MFKIEYSYSCPQLFTMPQRKGSGAKLKICCGKVHVFDAEWLVLLA